jgi:hypothetical protein
MEADEEIACALTSPEFQERKAGIIAGLKTKLTGRRKIHNGYHYEFPGDDVILQEVLEFIRSERTCCGFFQFQLNLSGSQSNIALTITGSPKAIEFLESEITL